MKQKSNYRILNPIGRGQFGRVFAAVDRRNGRLVALKELNQKYLSTSNFLRELHFLVSLNHPNIVSCHALEHYQNNRYLVMDYYEGGTLRDLINSSYRLTINESLRLVIDILKGLQYASDRGIVHRDIKPENILLKLEDRSWKACISDFGIAKLETKIDPQRNMGNTGSPAYMSPEQFYGQYSSSCDLYAVGIILYELVVGDRPFSGMPVQLIAAHINQPVTIPTTVPFMVRIAIAKSLQKLPHRRYPNAAAMAEALQLARDVLPQDYYLSLPLDRSQPKPLSLLSTRALFKPADKLIMRSQQRYMGTGDSLKIEDYADSSFHRAIAQWQIPLDNSISQLSIAPQGCFATTQSSLYYFPFERDTDKFRFFSQKCLPIMSFPTNSLVSSISPQANWFTVSYLPHKSQTPNWEIWQLPNCTRSQLQINRRRWHHLIVLNNRYGLGVYINKKHHTEFHLFNRRGIWLANFTLQIKLAKVVYNPQFPDWLLATEADNPKAVIVVNLKKIGIERIGLETTPTMIGTCDRGYLICDRHNNLTSIDGRDLSQQQFKIPLPSEHTITAIALQDTRLFVATTISDRSLLHQLSMNN